MSERADRESGSAGILAVELGGTNTRVAIVSSQGAIVAHDIESTAREDLYPHQLVDQIRMVVGDNGGGRRSWASRVVWTMRTGGWSTRRTSRRIGTGTSRDVAGAATGLDVALANDADLAAVGEHHFGRGRGVDDTVYVTISTGIGGGDIVGG